MYKTTAGFTIPDAASMFAIWPQNSTRIFVLLPLANFNVQQPSTPAFESSEYLPTSHFRPRGNVKHIPALADFAAVVPIINNAARMQEA